jgi:hypothetical protein
LANAFKITNAAANAEVDALTALMNGGSVKIYSGTAPATADTALSGNTLLATLPLSATAFGSGASGVATANAITNDSSADATGTASFFRGMKADGTTVVCQGTVGTTGADMNLNSTSISSGAAVSISSWTITQGKG